VKLPKQITKLTVQKKNRERMNVFLDGEFAFGISLLAAARLRVGQELTADEIEQLQDADAYQRAYNAALRYLSYRARSQAEVEHHLHEKAYAPEVVDATVARLLDVGYLDDVAFAEAWLRERARLRPKGARALRYELRQKGLDADVIDHALVDLDEEELAWCAVQSKLDNWQRLDAQTFQRKLSGYLSRRGFGYDTMRAVSERADALRAESGK